MIISSANDYRQVAKRKVPPFMFHYADGGSYSEHTLTRNVSDLSNIALRQRVLNDMSQLNTAPIIVKWLVRIYWSLVIWTVIFVTTGFLAFTGLKTL